MDRFRTGGQQELREEIERLREENNVLSQQLDEARQLVVEQEHTDHVATLAREVVRRAMDEPTPIDELRRIELAEEVAQPMIARHKEDLEAEERGRIREELMAPEEQARLQGKAEREVAELLPGLQRQEEAAVLKRLKEAAIHEAKADIQTALAGKYNDSLKQGIIKEWQESPAGQAYREESDKEAISRYMEEILKQARRELRDQAGERAKAVVDLIEGFYMTGAATDALPENVTIRFNMGGQLRECRCPLRMEMMSRQSLTDIQRTVRLISKGGGLFRVVEDSLSKDDNPYAASRSLMGKEVRLGRMTDGGEFEPTIVLNSPVTFMVGDELIKDILPATSLETNTLPPKYHKWCL